MRYAVALLVIAFIAVISTADSNLSGGRGAGYRTDYAAGRSVANTGRKEPNTFFVDRVVDGDTLRVDRREKVRLIGVDTPETKHPTKPVQYFGKEASQFTQHEVEHRFVTLKFDRHQRDKYGRLLAYVYRQPDHFFLNAELIKQGYGFAYTRFPFKYMEEFRQYEREARSEGRGLWQREKKTPSIEPVTNDPVSLDENIVSVPVENKTTTPHKKKTAKPEVMAENRAHPEGCDIKGNISSKGEKIYHVPGGRWYDKTKIDDADGERWFCTEEEAEKAGWRKAGARQRKSKN